MSLSGQFYVRPAAGELIRAVFAPEPDDRAILLGRLTDGSGMPVEDGAVLLKVGEETLRFEKGDVALVRLRVDF